MKNKKMKNIEIFSVIILTATLFVESAYVMVSGNYDDLLYTPKEKNLMAEQRSAHDKEATYYVTFHEQEISNMNKFYEEKSQRLDSMRDIHYQIEKDFLSKADSCYKLSKLYKDKIDEMNDSIAFASGVEADTSKFAEQKQKYIKKQNSLLKQGNQYTKDAFKTYEQLSNLRDSILYNDNYVLNH